MKEVVKVPPKPTKQLIISFTGWFLFSCLIVGVIIKDTVAETGFSLVEILIYILLGFFFWGMAHWKIP